MIKKAKKNGNAITVLTREEYLRKLAASKEPINIKLTNDYAFKKIFKNKKVLKGFLMALLNLEESEISDLEVIDPLESGECEEEKEGVLDIKIHLSSGRRINLEMQNRYQEDWSERSLFYNCRMFVEGYEHGTLYGDMETCIHVGILDFIQTKSPGFHHCVMLRDEKTGEVYSSKFIFHVIELKKLEETPKDERNELYRWAQLIAADSWEMVCEQADGNPYMEEVKEEMRKISQDEMQRYIYLREAMAVSDEKSRMVTARNAGIKEGIKEGVRVLIKICSNSGIEKETVQKQIEQEYQISAEEAQAYIQEYWK